MAPSQNSKKMEDSPVKHQPTSRVIDSLHSQIDSLRSELQELQMSNSDYKKKTSILASKNDSFVDQLANCKHENDMINALLKRKERRVADLEDQHNELSSQNESLALSNKQMKIRCESLQESSASSTAEYERLKIAYDALIASQNEYKRHYQLELNLLNSQFDTYKKDTARALAEITGKLTNNDKDIDTMLDSLTNKRKVMDNLYVSKNKAILELVVALAKTAKAHGEESKTLLLENINTVNVIRKTFPDLVDLLPVHEAIGVDLGDLLSETNDTLSALSDAEPAEEKPVARTVSRRRKNKRNSMRVNSPDPSEGESVEALPKPRARGGSRTPSDNLQRANQRANRNSQGFFSNQNGQYQNGQLQNFQHQNGQMQNQNGQYQNFQHQHFQHQNGHANSQDGRSNNANSGKNKRQLFYGGSNNFNSGAHAPLRKASGEREINRSAPEKN